MIQRKNTRKHRFRKGHSPHNKGVPRHLVMEVKKREILRLNRDVQEMVESTNYATAAREESAQRPMLLRPKAPRPTMLQKAQTRLDEQAEMDTYRLLHAGKTVDLFNEGIEGHTEFRPGCSGRLTFDPAGEIQRGLCWREQLMCSTCGYRSARRKLYKDVETARGPKPASANYGFQVGAKQTGASNTAICKMLLAADTPAPSRSSMQAAANKVGEVIIETNEKDMANIRNDIKTVQAARGHSSSIDVSVDCRYSNPIGSGVGVTPFQAANQMTQVVTENVTNRGKILGLTCQSKLCHVCALARSHGVKPKQHKCTATLSLEESIGDEKRWTKQSVRKLNADGLPVNILTTDPDGASFSAAEELFLEGESSVPPKHALDTRHVTSNQRKAIMKCDFSKTMFGVTTEKKKKYLQNRFASDLSSRCQAEHKAMMAHHGGDAARVSSGMPKTKRAISRCYTGDHSLCRKNSFVCRGTQVNNWVIKSCYLPNNFKLGAPTDNDLNKLNQCINDRLGQAILSKTKHLLNTQKCEATNKAIGSRVPRHITFTRNYLPRNHAAAHSLNAGISEAIVSECSAVGVPLTPGTRVTRRLLKDQQNDIRIKESKKSLKAKEARCAKKRRLYKLHADKPVKTNVYVKNDSMHIPEHSYCKVIRKNAK